MPFSKTLLFLELMFTITIIAQHTCVYRAGMEKVNFSGGEPFLPNKGDYLGELVRFCKQDLLLPSVSIVSNGSLIREHWFAKYG